MKGKAKIIVSTVPEGAFLQINQPGRAKAVVECFDIWSDTRGGWFSLDKYASIFCFPSRTAAMAQLATWNEQDLPVFSDVRVRSFDEWAESEGLVENLCNDPGQPPKQISGLPHARFSGKTIEDGVPIYYVPFPESEEAK